MSEIQSDKEWLKALQNAAAHEEKKARTLRKRGEALIKTAEKTAQYAKQYRDRIKALKEKIAASSPSPLKPNPGTDSAE